MSSSSCQAISCTSLLGFAVINGCTFALDLSLLTVFHGVLHWPVPVSITLSYGTASTLSYLLNRTLNFHSHGLVGRQVAVYVLVVAVNYFGLILGQSPLRIGDKVVAGRRFELSP